MQESNSSTKRPNQGPSKFTKVIKFNNIKVKKGFKNFNKRSSQKASPSNWYGAQVRNIFPSNNRNNTKPQKMQFNYEKISLQYLKSAYESP